MFPLTLSKFAGAAGRGLRLARSWLEVSRQRRRLAALDEQMLKDIGLNRAIAEYEAGRPFWDLPERYRHVSERSARAHSRCQPQLEAAPTRCGPCEV